MNMQSYCGKSVREGMKVRRVLAGSVPMDLRVTDVSETMVTCQWWTFDRATGAEIDEDLNWGIGMTGSMLTEMGDS